MLSKQIAAIGAAGSVPATVYLTLKYHHLVYTAVGVICFLACIGYLVLIRTKSRRTHYLFNPRLWDALYWLLIALSLVAFFGRPEPYERPLPYYILVALSVGALAGKILLADSRAWVTMAQVWIIGVSLVWTVTTMFPSLIGIDPYWHREQTLRIVEGLGSTSAMSGMHYWIAGWMRVTGLDYKWAAFLSVTTAQVVVDLAIMYGIGKMVAGKKVGLLAALFTVVGNWHLFFGTWVISNTFAATLFLIAVWAALKWYREKKAWWLALMLVPVAGVLTTHALVAVWVALSLVLLLAVVVLSHRRSMRQIAVFCGLIIAVLVAEYLTWDAIGYTNTLRILAGRQFSPQALGLTDAPMLGDKAQVFTTSPPAAAPAPALRIPAMPTGSTFETTASPTIVNAPILTEAPPAIETLSTYQVESLINVSGMLLYFGLALVGMLLLVRRKGVVARYVALLIGVFLAIGTVPMLLEMSVLEHRWWYIAQILASVPLAVVIVSVARRTGRWITVVLGAVSVLAFLNMIGLPGNIDNRALSPNQIVRYALTAEEIETVRTVMAGSEGSVGMDACLTVAVSKEQESRIKNIWTQLKSGELDDAGDWVIIWDEVRRGVLGYGDGGVYRLMYDPVERLLGKGYSVVSENNGTVVMKRD